MGDPARTDIYHKCIVKRFDRPYSQPIRVVRTETFANMECYEWLSNLAKSMVGANGIGAENPHYHRKTVKKSSHKEQIVWMQSCTTNLNRS